MDFNQPLHVDYHKPFEFTFHMQVCMTVIDTGFNSPNLIPLQ